MQLWYPGADNTTQNFLRVLSRPEMTSWPILLLHTTEGPDGSWPGYNNGGTAPNITVQGRAPHSSRGHFPVNYAAQALLDPDATPVRENRICTQIEIVATCDYRNRGKAGWTHVDDLPETFWRWLGQFMHWLVPHNGMPLTTSVQWRAYQRQVGGVWVDDPNGAYGLRAPQRLSSDAFGAYRGVCGHQHASGNDHADPGPIGAGVQKALAYAGSTQEIPVSDVKVSNDPPAGDAGYYLSEQLYAKPDGSLWVTVPASVVLPPPVVIVPPPVDVPPPVVQPPPVSGDTAPNGYKYQMAGGDVWVGLLHFGQEDSDSVRRMQDRLNGKTLPPPGNVTLDLTPGSYGPKTDDVVRTWQVSIGNPADPVGASSVGPKQAALLFEGSPHVLRAGVPPSSSTPPPPVVTPPPATGGISTPFPGAVITTPFGVPGNWAAKFHTGQDYACPVGTPLRATWTGKVVATNAWGAAYGNHVIYEQTINGVVCRTAYCHMSRIEIGVGAATVPGTNFGKSGNTGNTTGPHVHVEQRTAPYAYNNRVQKPVM